MTFLNVWGENIKEEYFVTCGNYMEFTFVSISVSGTQACPFVYVLSVAAVQATTAEVSCCDSLYGSKSLTFSLSGPV